MSEQQSFESHAHRPTHTVVAAVFFVVAATAFSMGWPPGASKWMAIGGIALMGSVFTLIWISRAYTTRLQDRIIRVEMRLRALQLLTPAQQQAMEALSLKQLAALRFASDAELPSLTEQAAREKLPPKEIKRAIKTWIADHART